ncbi:hypothetical protein YQE_07956, partial [Dendroctonus ponderosae]
MLTLRTLASDITPLVFGGFTEGMPAAFGDFNSDELTDVFVVLENNKAVEILLAHEEEPLLRQAKDRLRCVFSNSHITSVVPGDFDGDALMDVMVTTTFKRTEQDTDTTSLTNVYILWGGANHLNCTTDEDSPVIQMIGQPLAMDYNQDMIIDLNHDYMADLFITTPTQFEVWLGHENEPKFTYNNTIKHPENSKIIGQSLFVDVELKGSMDLVTPVCAEQQSNGNCKGAALMVYSEGQWINLQVNFKDDAGNLWQFYLKQGKTEAIFLFAAAELEQMKMRRSKAQCLIFEFGCKA